MRPAGAPKKTDISRLLSVRLFWEDICYLVNHAYDSYRCTVGNRGDDNAYCGAAGVYDVAVSHVDGHVVCVAAAAVEEQVAGFGFADGGDTDTVLLLSVCDTV